MSTFLWRDARIAFRPGETIASALARAGLRDLGGSATGGRHAVFCGIGQCQNCLVLIDGRAAESCLTPCATGLVVQPLESRDA